MPEVDAYLVLDIVAALGVFGSVVIACVIWKTHKSQQTHQINVDSARLLLSVYGKIRDEQIQTFLRALYANASKSKTVPYPPNELISALSYFDIICTYYNDGVLTWEHVRSRYTGVFQMIKEDKQLQEYIESHELDYRALKLTLERV